MAENYTAKRRDMGTKAIDAATQVVQGIQALISMQPELAQVGGGFEDADFVTEAGNPTADGHVNAWKMNNLINAVAPALKAGSATPIGPGTTVTHLDILLAVKRA